MGTSKPNYEGCNHSLSLKAIEAANAMETAHGNAPFDWQKEKYSERIVNQLLDQGFLIEKNNGVARNKIIIGKVPYHLLAKVRK